MLIAAALFKNIQNTNKCATVALQNPKKVELQTGCIEINIFYFFY
jgi:hypothetical protein